MIQSFACNDTEQLFHRQRPKRFPQSIHRVAFRKLRMLHRARTLQDLRVPPGNRLELLKGDRRGQYSIRVNDQVRICFTWQSGDAFQVEMVDYH
ncbi:MAG: type II toxin-antitoxin system RelE/ParE family toxin [Pirellulaceae bacterium]|nr:type II toxin-antitoxin system RelE/ParE family toxin [Pirellulaceae bacterium]